MVQRGLNEMHGYIVHDEGFYQKCKIHELLIKDSCRRAGSMWSYNKKCVEAKKIFSFPPHDDLYLGKTKRMYDNQEVLLPNCKIRGPWVKVQALGQGE